MELKTPLYNAHVKAGGKIVPFAYGWSERRQFHPAIQISHCIRQSRNRDR